MSDVDTTDLDAFTLHLRNKSPLGRLTDAEVRDVLAFLADLGMAFAPAPVAPIEAETVPAAPILPFDPSTVIPPLPNVDPAPVIPPPPAS